MVVEVVVEACLACRPRLRQVGSGEAGCNIGTAMRNWVVWRGTRILLVERYAWLRIVHSN